MRFFSPGSICFLSQALLIQWFPGQIEEEPGIPYLAFLVKMTA